ncbi:MAG: hypothetical protein M3Q19_06255 [Pseudomonadota bacterium]|nr:hypothetical protein [Pseudomonadota bacterium]
MMREALGKIPLRRRGEPLLHQLVKAIQRPHAVGLFGAQRCEFLAPLAVRLIARFEERLEQFREVLRGNHALLQRIEHDAVQLLHPDRAPRTGRLAAGGTT